ncbi:hypothetical protein [Pedobacter sp.]|uniref:hypothetical protein n=1 Tax=Pedobacter sp. TaxID=1411316 RepID=UPI003D7F9A1B
MKTKFSKDFLYFAWFSLIFCLSLVVLDQLLGAGFNYYYHQQYAGTLYRTNMSIDSTRAQVVIVGSSRANYHYDAPLMSRKLGKTVYNCGREGQGLLYSCAVVSAIVARHRPELVIMDILPKELSFHEEERLASLLPYYQNKEIRPYLDFADKYQEVKLLSKTYPFNSLLTSIIVGRLSYSGREKEEAGFISLEGRIPRNEVIHTERDDQNLVLRDKLLLFEIFLGKMERQKIHCLLVMSPMYNHYIPGATRKFCKLINSKYKFIRFLDFTNKTEYFDPSLYNDSFHLNDTGAARFSAEVVKRIH